MHTDNPGRLDAELDEAERKRLIDFVLESLNQSHKERLADADPLEGGTEVRGYDHAGAFDFERFLAAMATTGFQATNLARAIGILREVRDRDVPLYLGFTSNIGTCGLRETVTYLTRNRHVRGLATTAGAVEEDVMKVFRPFMIGSFDADGKELYDRMINRTGNIFVPSGRYTRLHLLLAGPQPAARAGEGRARQRRRHHRIHLRAGPPVELLEIPGRETSFVYWAYRHKIPLHCPVLLDGAIGDSMYYYRREQSATLPSTRPSTPRR